MEKYSIYEYNATDHVVSTKDPMGKIQYATYDWKGNVLSQSSKKDQNVTTDYTYDELYRPVVVENMDGGKTYTRYDSSGNVLSNTDALGNTNMYEYDIFGRKTKEIAPGDTSIQAGWTTYKYDKDDRITSSENSLGKVTSYTYNDAGKVLTQSEKEKNVTQEITVAFEYDSNGNKTQETDGNGNVTKYAYNNVDLVSSKEDTIAGAKQKTTYVYDPERNLKTTTDYRGNVSTIKYDELNQVTEKIDANGKTIEKNEYLPEQSQVKQYDALGNVTQKFYDKNKRTTKVVSPAGGVTQYGYDAEGNTTTSTDGKNNVTKYEYDNMNRLTKVINAKNETTEIAYDLNGNMLSMKDGKGNITQYEYNVVGKPVKRIDPGGKDGSSYVAGRFESYSYRADGSLASKIDRKGQSFTYTYDVFGRMTKKEAGTAQVSYEYDKNDNLTKMTDATGSTVRKYDELDRCIEKTVPTIGKSTYQYDVTTGVAEGFKGEKTIDPKGNSTLKVYDKTGKLNAVTAETGTTNYDYYDNGSQKKVTLPNGVTSEYTYDADSRLKTLANKKDATVIEQYSYDYDAAGNMTKKKDKKGDTAYEYDQLNRIQKVTEPGSKVTSYTYDAAGNRASETANGKTYQYTYDNRNRLTQVDATSDAVKKVFEYDNNGNQIKQKDVTKSTNAESVIQENTYDVWNQLTQTKAGSTTVKNTYNGDGLRTAKDVNGQSTQYLYEFDKVVLETDNSGNQTSRNVYGTNLISKTNGADTYNYIYNGHGDVTGLTDGSGTVKASYYYDAFGNITEQTGTCKQRNYLCRLPV